MKDIAEDIAEDIAGILQVGEKDTASGGSFRPTPPPQYLFSFLCNNNIFFTKHHIAINKETKTK
jgi:hypothetical protein